MSSTLIVRHLPSTLTDEQKIDFLNHFGAASVRCMSNNGPLKHIAFASFETHEDAKNALSRLHQLELLGHKLVVEYAKDNQSPSLPTLDDNIKKDAINSKNEGGKEKQPESEQKQLLKFFKKLHSSISGADYGYPISPMLKYIYPPANPAIVQNIAQVLLSVPKFYVQVLHLMNKMNLPPPFTAGSVMATPAYLDPSTAMFDVQEEDGESEIESDDDNHLTSGQLDNTVLQPIKRKKPPRKRPRLEQLMPQSYMNKDHNNLSTKPLETEDVFEASDSSKGNKKIEMKLPSKVEMTEQQAATEVSGFGKMDPTLAPEKSVDEDDSEPCFMELDKYIGDTELRNNRISKSEMKEWSAFKKYDSGTPSTRLYLKNLPKQVSEQDILYVYGRYVNWNSEQEKNVFDIRLMKEGRMKGQGFITFLNEESAKKALKDTNGYMFNGKPVVVQFARSAKPKEDDGKKK